MRQSKYFLKTSTTVASDEAIVSAKFLKQGGFITESVAGRYYFLPIGHRVHKKIEQVIREEMDKAGAEEMVTPVLHPLELWQETNRTNSAGFELMRVKDRRGAEFALGGTAEEMFVDMVRKFTVSYRELPFHLYQFSSKFRDELRARGGLLRVREFTMKDGYSFHVNEEDFKKTYAEMKQVYTRIFERLGLKTQIVESDNGYIGGEYCHEFIVESPVGESRYFTTTDGVYAAHEDVAVFEKKAMNSDEPLKDLQEVDAVRGTTMEDGVKLHNLPLWRQVKDVMFVDEKGRFILAIIRGDFDVNETKLKHISGAMDLRHATEEEIRDILNSEPGFISPVGIKERNVSGTELIIVADDSLRQVRNSYGGANQKNKDLLNMNIDRDYYPDLEGDIALAQPGAESVGGHGPLIEKRGIEVGNIFQLGYHYSKLMQGAVFTAEDGTRKPYYMGCYGIGLGRTLATIVESNCDAKGILWPETVAPFRVHLIALKGGKGDELYERLRQSGVQVLYDDRDEAPGVKFTDADLLGIPWRLVVSAKTGDQVELKRRNEQEAKLMSVEEAMRAIGM